MKGAATSLSIEEIEKQLRMGLSASREADDALMRDAADMINQLRALALRPADGREGSI